MSKFKYTGNVRAIPTEVEEKKGGKKTGKMLKEHKAGTVVASVEFPTNTEVEVNKEDNAACFATVSRLANEENGPFELVGGKKAPKAPKAPKPPKAPKAPPPAKKEGDK